MTSRHNERTQARRHALREQHKRELEEAKRRQAAQLSAITTFDQRIARLEAAELEVAESVAEAVEVFGGRKEAAEALGLTSVQVRDYISAHEKTSSKLLSTELEKEPEQPSPNTRNGLSPDGMAITVSEQSAVAEKGQQEGLSTSWGAQGG
ncbi:hypothetical protein [Streptomyces nodosus]|uniref:hypothetical protein n=1 Tax=Streptomyces nodosus TaxID=40318 RepID=UPI003814587D